MNRGTMRGFATTIGDYQPNPQGGSWSGNRGRFQVDEIRMLGIQDGQLNWLANAGGARLFNTNPSARAGSPVAPGDIAMVSNIGSGTMQLQGAPAPYAAAYNVAGKYRVGTSAGSTTAAFELNAISDNVNGLAQNLMGLVGVTSSVLYIANGAAAVAPTVTGDITSLPLFGSFNSGTLTCTSYSCFRAGGVVGGGATLTNRVGYGVDDVTNTTSASTILASGTGTITNQYGVDIPILLHGSTLNTAIRIGQGGQTLTALPPGNGQIDVYTGTTTLNFASSGLPPIINFGGTMSLTQSASALAMVATFFVHPTITNTVGSSSNFGPLFGMYYNPTFTANTQTGLGAGTSTGYFFSPVTSVSNAGTITSGGFVGMEAIGTIGAGTTIAAYTGLLCAAPTITGTLTSWIGVDIAAVTGAGTNIGIRNASSLRQQGAFIATNNVVTVTSNAGTVAVTNYLSTFTNSSAATMAITMAVTGAVDGQKAIVRIYDFSAVTETIGWTNTENGGAAVPLTSNGSTTLPLTVGFIFNGQTTKWRCVASV